MDIQRFVVSAVACATAVVAVYPVQGQSGGGGYGTPFLATVDDFRDGGYAYLFDATSPAAQTTQTGINVMGNRRLSTLSALAAPGGAGGATGSAVIDTSDAGTLTVAAAGSVYLYGVFIFSYGRVADPTWPSLMQNFDFPGTHGLAVDFNSLSGPIHVEINIGTWSTAGSGITEGTWSGTVSPDPSGGPFRFRTTWSQYSVNPGFDIASVDYINVGFYAPAGTIFSVDGIGVSPAPSAGWAMGLVGLTAVRRRRTG